MSNYVSLNPILMLLFFIGSDKNKFLKSEITWYTSIQFLKGIFTSLKKDFLVYNAYNIQ